MDGKRFASSATTTERTELSSIKSTSSLAIAAAVVVSRGRLRSVRRRIGEGALSWQLPAGKVEPGEMPDVAAVGETAEEAGVEVPSSSWTSRTTVTSRTDLPGNRQDQHRIPETSTRNSSVDRGSGVPVAPGEMGPSGGAIPLFVRVNCGSW
jgi:8-oxo-dGTP pyrophosphatase MutT (NUDIX family)